MIRFGKKIPITITPAFWIFAAVIGVLSTWSILGALLWMGIIFVSVLVHEWGHAVAALSFGGKPRIELVAFGGLTYHNTEKLPFWKQFLIVLNGPLFGFALFLLAGFLLQFPFFSGGALGGIVLTLKWVNLFWTVLNLLPILPLDGGQLMRILFEGFFGFKGVRYALIISMGLAFSTSLIAFFFREFFLGSVLFFFGFQSLEMWKQSRLLSPVDQDESVKSLLKEGEDALESGDKARALRCFHHVCMRTGKGKHYMIATEYLGFLHYEEGDLAQVYRLLSPHASTLSLQGLCLLQIAAFAQQDYPLTEKLGGVCFQKIPSSEIAVRTAYACGAQHKTPSAIGWLEAALDQGVESLGSVLADPHFDPIRDEIAFRKFIATVDPKA